MCKRDERGFTLIELLVVIAIIAILAAILFPVFATAKKRAQAMTCVDNMRQIGMAHSMYMDENNSILVPIGVVGTGLHGSIYPSVGCVYWPDMLSKYMKTVKLLHCPVMKTFGLGMNHMQLGKWIALNTPRSGLCALSDIAHPMRTVCFADTGLVINPAEPNPDKWIEDPKATGFCWFRTPDNVGYYDVAGSSDRIVNRHNGQAVCAFVDGHVQIMPVSKVGFQFPLRDPRAMWDIY